MGLVSALQDLGDRATTQGGKDLIALLIDVYRAGTQANAQPRPRSQVASSTSASPRNDARVCASSNAQAGNMSQAGSPMPNSPKSITPVSRPCVASRFVG
jgi:hypothetical protein